MLQKLQEARQTAQTITARSGKKHFFFIIRQCFSCFYILIYICLWFSGVSLNKAWQTEFLKSYPDLNVDWKSVLSRYNYHFGNLDSIGQNVQPKDLGSSGKYIFIIFICIKSIKIKRGNYLNLKNKGGNYSKVETVQGRVLFNFEHFGPKVTEHKHQISPS